MMSRFVFLWVLMTAASVTAAETTAYTHLVRQFQDPPRQARPWVYWVWLANTTPAALTRDLEAMKAKGIVGCILYDVQTGRDVNWWTKKVVLVGKEYRAVPTDDYRTAHYTPFPTGPLPSWSPHWRKLVCFAAGQCARLGIRLVVSDGLANTSGRIPIKDGEQKLVWTQITLRGPEIFDGRLPAPKLRVPGGDFPRTGLRFYQRGVAVLAVPDQAGFTLQQVVNLTGKMNANGHLRWEVPKGKWKILRFVQVPTGAHNRWGYYCDSLSTHALDQTWAVTMAPLLEEMTPAERRGLKGIEDDSWEAGKTTWTRRFPEAFKQRRGYDLIPYLPVLAGMKMGNATMRARVRRDYRLTISDLIAANHYGHLTQLAHQNGLLCYSEAAGPDYDQADDLKTCSRVDEAMGEFWMPCAHRPTMNERFLLRNAANANHIYGKRITLCEAFTSLGPEWQQSPFTMKPVADQAFCDGLNRVCIHNFSQSPSLTAKPGYVYCAGTHYEPGITWWNETPAFNLYLARCSALLQAGRFHADAIVYRGDNVGRGEPRKAVLPTLGKGYDHDNCNSEVLRTRMGVRHGRIVLKDGMSYRVLILPSAQAMPLRDLQQVADLAAAGATVLGPPPTRLAGMPRSPSQQRKFHALVARLWGGLNGNQVTQKRVGTGRVVWGETAREVLEREGAPPDFAVRGLRRRGTIDWIHRQVGRIQIYYVASHWAHPETVLCTFRVAGRQPELWNPVTGQIRQATAFHQADGRTSIPLQFGPCGSVFVVFHRPIPAKASGTTASNFPILHQLTNLSGPWTVHFDPKWGGPPKVVFTRLMDWTNSPDPGIKYYSGTAVYRQSFSLNHALKKGQRLVLDLGQVDDVARVRLNGHNLGVVWTQPARVDITDAVKAQNNHLEIAVVNLWPNRLIRDASLPKAQRLTETNIHKFGPESPLLPSGLIGPVSLFIVQNPSRH